MTTINNINTFKACTLKQFMEVKYINNTYLQWIDEKGTTYESYFSNFNENNVLCSISLPDYWEYLQGFMIDIEVPYSATMAETAEQIEQAIAKEIGQKVTTKYLTRDINGFIRKLNKK